MGLNFNLNLPGPFTYSARISPPIKPIAKAAGQVLQAGQRPVRRPDGRPAASSEDAYAQLGLVIGALLLPVEWWLLGMWL